jgi:hypothetical protein
MQMLPIRLPRFRHTPPSRIVGTSRWPSSSNSQGCPSPEKLSDVLSAVWQFLATDERQTVCTLSRDYSRGPYGTAMWLTPPWPPLRRRRWGFGVPSKNRSISHDRPSFLLITHHIWTYMTPSDRFQLLELPAVRKYAHLRATATWTSVSDLRHPVLPKMHPTRLSPRDAALNGMALLRFDFNYGDFMRWLSGRYTHRYRSWNTVFDKIVNDRHHAPLPTQPPVDLFRAHRICTQGIPLVAQYTSPLQNLESRDIMPQ